MSTGFKIYSSTKKAAADMVIGVMSLHEISTLLEIVGFEFSLISASEPIDSSSHFTMGQIISGVNERRLEELVQISNLGQRLRFLVYLMKGRYDDVEQQRFYVDVRKGGTTVPKQIVIDRGACDGAMRTAKKAIWATKLELKDTRASCGAINNDFFTYKLELIPSTPE